MSGKKAEDGSTGDNSQSSEDSLRGASSEQGNPVAVQDELVEDGEDANLPISLQEGVVTMAVVTTSSQDEVVKTAVSPTSSRDQDLAVPTSLEEKGMKANQKGLELSRKTEIPKSKKVPATRAGTVAEVHDHKDHVDVAHGHNKVDPATELTDEFIFHDGRQKLHGSENEIGLPGRAKEEFHKLGDLHKSENEIGLPGCVERVVPNLRNIIVNEESLNLD